MPFSGEIPIQFSFRGNIKDGKLDGPGKLKLGQKVLMDGWGTCIRLNKYQGHYPVEIVGTFVNGVLSGNAKIIFSNGKVMIAGFANGLAEGFRREWDESGNLSFVGFSYKGAKAGKAWQRIGKNLMYTDVATINRSDDLSIVIPIDNGPRRVEALAGKLWHSFGILDDVHGVQIFGSELNEQSCILKLSAKPNGNALNSLYDLTGDKFIDTGSCNFLSQKTFGSLDSNIPQKLEKWYYGLNLEVVNNTFHQAVLQMRQEKEEPTSGSLIISEISFNDENVSESYPASMNVTFFEQQQSKVYVRLASFDEQSKFHGLVQLQVDNAEGFEQNFGFELRHVSGLVGVFKHGIIEGLVQLDLWVT